MSDEGADAARGTGMSRFRPRGAERPRLGRDEARRQGAIVTLAFTLLGGRDEALTFLNTTSKVLKMRPIDLAMQNEIGFLRVETLIRKLGSGSPES